MTDPDRSRALAELLATPLDAATPHTADREDRREPRPAPWGIVTALLAGAFIVLGAFWIAGPTDAEETVPTTTPPTTAGPVAEADTFPPGYTAVDDAVAVRIERIARSGPDLAVTMTSVIARGLDAAGSTPFTGGRWSAELRDGSTVPARGQAVEPSTPGIVTALFDPEVVTLENLAALRLTERWYNHGTMAVQEFEIDGSLPWSLPEPELLDLGDGAQLVVNRLELTETGGVAEWTLAGGNALGLVTVMVELDEGSFDGQPRVMIPVGDTDRFFFDPATAVPEGRIELSGPTAADAEGVVFGVAVWSVRLTVTTPADAAIPVPALTS